MINVIQSYSSQVCQQLPKLKIDSAENMIRKATSIAIPAIALVSASNVELADGIGATYAVCIATCAVLFKDNAVGMGACLAACLALLPLP